MKADEVFGTLNKRIEQGGVTDETIKKIVEQYFEEHPVEVITDNTLSVAGAPADAKVTGDKLSGLEEKTNSLKEDIGDIESKFEIETEAFVNKCSIIRNNTPNNFIGNQITGIKQYFDFGKNATLTKIKMNIKASNDDTVVLEIATLDDNIIVTAENAVTTEYTDVVFDLENIVIKEPISVFVYTKEPIYYHMVHMERHMKIRHFRILFLIVQRKLHLR